MELDSEITGGFMRLVDVVFIIDTIHIALSFG